jgi:cytochrome b involved in lipid metabolism
MGWIRGNTPMPKAKSKWDFDSLKPSSSSTESEFALAPLSTPDSELPLRPSSLVKSKASNPKGSSDLWIVIDGIVYDCTAFAPEHPSGVHMIESFRGFDCNWQFWRFHGKSDLEQYGKYMRIGRTEGVGNKYKEPKFVGWSGFGFKDW